MAAGLGIAANQLHPWRRQHAENSVHAFPGNGKINSRDEELHRLRNDLKHVTEERDFLKKATAFFATGAGPSPKSRTNSRTAHLFTASDGWLEYGNENASWNTSVRRSSSEYRAAAYSIRTIARRLLPPANVRWMRRAISLRRPPPRCRCCSLLVPDARARTSI